MSLVEGLLNQRLTSISKPTVDGYGDKTYTIVYTDTPCRWEETIEYDVLPNGDTIIYTVRMFLFPDLDIKKGYRVIRNSKNYTVQKYDLKVDLSGNDDHWEVWLN